MTESTLRWLLELGRPERTRLIMAMVLGSLAAAATVALMGTSAYLISRASQQPPVLTLTVVIVCVRFFGISRGVARYAERLVGHDAAFRVVADLRVEVYRRIEPLVPAHLAGRRSGDVLTRFATDVESIADAYLRVFPAFGTAAIVGVGAVVAMALIDPWVGLVLGTGLVVSAWLTTVVVAASVRQSQRQLAAGRAAYSDRVLDLLAVLPETWVADTSGPLVDGAGAARERLLADELRVSRGYGVGQAIGGVIAGLTLVLSLLLGAVAVQRGAVDGVMLAVLVLTPLAALDVVAAIPDAVRRWARVREAADRVRELVDAAPEASAECGTTAAPSDAADPTLALDLVTATVSWPGADHPALRGVSLSVPEGARVAIVGHSGAGKSTAAMALAGFLPLEQGSLLVSGRASGALKPAELHRVVGLLEQRPYVFDTSVGENLRIARPDATPSELVAVLERVSLGPWLQTLPSGLDARVGEHGRQLSGGQRQRLGLARLLLSQHPVIVLDEPDEHLDAPAADALMADLLHAASGRTVVVISHRLSPLTGVDQIYVFDEGRVVESGSHGALVARGGWYARTWMREREVTELVETARDADRHLR
jgi:thiol reductant ABC exporter CydC subunit